MPIVNKKDKIKIKWRDRNELMTSVTISISEHVILELTASRLVVKATLEVDRWIEGGGCETEG